MLELGKLHQELLMIGAPIHITGQMTVILMTFATTNQLNFQL
jgi:hypothetical protein